ncbi:hypothetical protein TOPH_08606 [Tolypocladium ophioglossoides CBS 100239]|uniref:Mid2 domain-containing protein n=1 Tax=Tolypocladium ophioglossoides (strain CBS 100239) TaxID=1163406 RepID=A0A0L0MYZ7_TOLOC|nr:hypothetical protein TOPH_08606 [Tolypocladium ophioglossoides CBS 100239]
MATAGTPSTTTGPAPAVTSFALNPLTTTFSRPADCTGVYQSLFLTMMDLQTTCLPKGFKSQSDAYFSPGIACPSGYVSACHDNTRVASQTTVTCCPTLNSNISLSCVTASTITGLWSTLFCTWIAPPASKQASLPVTVSNNGVTSTEMRGFQSPGGINAFGVRMVYQKTDVVIAAATTNATTALSTGPAGSDGSEPILGSSSSSSSNLSTGAIAAIGVVIPLLVIGILAGALLWWRWRRRQHAQVESLSKFGEAAPQPQPQPHAELHGDHVQEMPGSTVEPVELPASEPEPPPPPPPQK